MYLMPHNDKLRSPTDVVVALSGHSLEPVTRQECPRRGTAGVVAITVTQTSPGDIAGARRVLS
jgi:hypothetical protein